MKPTSGRELVVPVTVEFEDVDSYRIAHHTKLVAYLERARLRFIKALGIDLDQEPSLAPVVYDLKVRFRKPAKLLDELEVALTVREYYEYKLLLDYRIRRNGETLLRASSGIAFVDLKEQKIVPAPEAYIEALESYLASETD